MDLEPLYADAVFLSGRRWSQSSQLLLKETGAFTVPCTEASLRPASACGAITVEGGGGFRMTVSGPF